MNQGIRNDPKENKRSLPTFKISSALKNLIGKELVTNKYVAMLELVKNSYDANASDVWIVFEHKNKEGEVSLIKVIDNGGGMKEEDVFEKWLFVGFSSKKDNSTNKISDFRSKDGPNRSMAGQKGIGRFSCDTLGESLRMITRTAADTESHVLLVDWAKFEKDQRAEFKDIGMEFRNEAMDLFTLPDGKRTKEGTILEISRPRDNWSHADLEKLTRYLQRMVNPYSSESEDTFRITLIAEIYKDDDKKYQEIIDQKKDGDETSYLGPRPVNGPVKNTIIDDIKELTTRISSKIRGNIIETSLIDKENLIYKITEKSNFDILDNCNADIFYLNTRAKTQFTSRMGVRPVNFGSIYVYKNYFRVLPYGDEGDDWLGLDRKKGQGYARFLSTREIIGRVAVKDDDGKFKEVSSREGGLLRDQAFEELKSYTTKYCVERLTKYVTGAIKWDGKKSPSPDERKLESLKLVSDLAGISSRGEALDIKVGEDLFSIIQDKMVMAIPEMVSQIQNLASEVKGDSRGEAIIEWANSLKSSLEIVENNMKAKDHERLFMAKAKSTEDFTKSILHEVKQSAPSIVKALTRISYALTSSGVPKTVMDDLTYALRRTRRIEQISKMGSLANFKTTTDRINEAVPKFIVDYVSYAAQQVSDMSMEPIFKNSELNVRRNFSPVELTIILDNIWTNAYKAGATKVNFSFEYDDPSLVILISDNGSGVSQDAFELMFTQGFSTRGGSGLGLYTSRIFAQSNGWKLEFVGNNIKGQERGACFKLVM